MDADEVAANAWDQRPVRGHRPPFEVGIQKVGVLFEVVRGSLVPSLPREGRGTDQGGYLGCQG